MNGFRVGAFIFFLLTFHSFFGYSQVKDETELRRDASKYFDEERYDLAYKFYSQLVANYPKDPEFNYRVGVCMLYTDPDKKKPFPYLKIATNNPKDAPKDALFYLAKTYHINYQFDEALKLYNDYKQIGSSSSIKKLQVDKEMQACKNGKRLLAHLTDLVVINKKQLNEADYFRSYDLKNIGGKLLVKPDEFRSQSDKKKKEKSVMYLPRNGDRVYYSSYGENGSNGRDIFYSTKTSKDSWSAPQIMPLSINTEYDEDYPFLHPNGKTLYFCSKGHNSMGGYDIFKTTFDETTNSWSAPVNLDFPINSPDDDILFVTDSLEKTAYFSTGRYSPYGKYDVLKINTERRPLNFAVLKGTVTKEEVTQSLNSKITVKNSSNGEIVGTYTASENGEYSIELANGGKFNFSVETPGIATQSEEVNIPNANSIKPYKQVISYDKKILKITNYFDNQNGEDSYSALADLIEKKAKLSVNENVAYNAGINEPIKNQNGINDTGNQNAVSTTNPSTTNSSTIASNSNVNSNTNKNITNEQLLEMSKTDAKEAIDEAIKLKKEAEDAFGLATRKTAEAIEIQKEADAIQANANNISDINKKNEEIAKATNLKEEANAATNIAILATSLAKKLEVDANLQQQEADLTNQYIKEIEAVTKNKNNKVALAKLEEIQKQLSELSKQKNQSDELYTSLKAELELKQSELKKSESISSTLATEISSIGNEAKDLEKDLVNESDNSIKDNIKAQIKELTNEIEAKNKELETNNQKITTLKNEVANVNKEIEITAKILNEKTDIIAANYDNSDKTDGTVTTNTLNTVDEKNTAITSNASTIVANTNTIAANTNTIAVNTNTIAVNTNTIAANSNSDITNSNPINNSAYQKITSKYESQITTNKVTTKEDIKVQNAVIENYNKEASDLIVADQNQLSKTNDDKEKEQLSEEIKKLEKIKIDNDDQIAVNNFKIAQLETASSIPNTTSTVNTPSVEIAIGNTSTVSVNPDTNGVSTTTNEIAITNSTPVSTNTTNTSTTDIANNNSDAVSVNSNTTVKSETPANNITSNNKIETLTKVNEILNEVDSLDYLAKVKRKDASSKTGVEQKTLLKQASDYSKLAATKRIQASGVIHIQNKNEFDNNTKEIIELKKLTGTNTNPEIIQANTLLDEATLNFNQAQKIRAEANTNTNIAAKLGGLSNADEKENEALLKQQKGLEILAKENPTYKSENPADTSSIVNNALPTNRQQILINNLLEQSKANINELQEKGDRLISQPAFNSPENRNLLDLKLKADVLKNEAEELSKTVQTTKNLYEKVAIMEEVTKKEKRSLKLLNESYNVFKRNDSIAKSKDLLISNPNTVATSNTFTVGSTKENINQNENISSVNNTSIHTTNSESTIATETIPKSDNTVSSTNEIAISSQENKLQEPITSLLNEANKLSRDAIILRKSSDTKIGPEKDKDLNEAISLENQATTKKIEAANKQEKLNTAIYIANKQSLAELEVMAKGKNISELNSVNIQLSEADVLLKQASILRTETNNYPTNSAKLGGYSNAEEKESLALEKQKAALAVYKKYFSNYTAKEPVLITDNSELTTNSSSIIKNQQIVDSLRLLNDSNVEIYKNRLLTLNTNLNPIQIALKTRAQAAFKKNQDINNTANKTTNLNQKKNLLIDAEKNLAIALDLLNQINKNASIEPNLITAQTNNTPITGKDAKKEELVVIKPNAYTNAKPIPIDTKLPDGLIYKVQIGAFRTVLPNNAFKGLSPVVGQTTPNGLIRYMAGNFEKIENANAVKNDLINLGYKDAFVVAYNNGVRVNLSGTTNITANPNNGSTAQTINVNNTTAESPIITAELEKMNGLLFTVQIGVFTKQTNRSQLFNLKPIYTEQLPNGLFRYTAGIYNQSDLIISDKRKVVDIGIKDAFITSYYNSKRISFTDGKKLQLENSNLKMETQNPIIFNEGLNSNTINNSPNNTIPVNPVAPIKTPINTAIVNITAFTNGITTAPIPTTENGVKTDEAGISYKVQIGAYRYQVPNEEAAKFLSIKDWPISNVVINGLYIYTIGNFSGISYAKKLKDQAIAIGISDVYITVYKDGKKLYGNEALSYINQ